MAERIAAVLGRGLVDAGTPVVHADDLGFTRGDGCFEGMRLMTDAAGVSVVDKPDAHLDRLGASAGALGIEFDRAGWSALIQLAATAWTRPGEAGLRLFLSRGRAWTGSAVGVLTIEAMAPSYPAQRRDGISVVTLARGTTIDAFAEDTSWLLGGVKTISYAVNMAAQREAVRRGADDAVFVSADGWVLESPTGSVVWADGRTLCTIPLGPSGILGGTTQQRLFARAQAAGWTTAARPLRAAELPGVDALWITSSLRGPVEVVELDGSARPSMTGLTREIQQLAGF